MKGQARTIMVQGTASDVGKSILAAALCRIFLQDGYRVVPFKSQNMSLNSYITPDGKEIGRAQGLQADASRVAATTDMNPILLKPKKDMEAQVVVHGKPYKDLSARAYREEYLPLAEEIVKDSLANLRAESDIVVIEGAGSPAEVNLKDRDIVNMRMAGWADAPVVLVADIDRGGVFASIVGTLEILTPEERDRVRGFVINKFRGDVTLLKPGLDWLETRTGKPVLGVVPYLHDLGLEDEDTASLESKLHKRTITRHSADILDIAVLRLPRMSNFTDFDPLVEEPDVALRYVTTPSEFGQPDAVIVPGSKNSIDDLLFLRETGLERLIHEHVTRGGALCGICGGYQMLGEQLLDPGHLESQFDEVRGLGFFPIETEFTPEKRTVRVEGFAAGWDRKTGSEPAPVEGYEIHMGRTRFLRELSHPFRIRDQKTHQEAAADEGWRQDGVMSDSGRIWGTYIHGILNNDEFRRMWLNGLREAKGLEPLEQEVCFTGRREAAFDRLAEHVRRHLDMGRIYGMMEIVNQR